MPVPKTQASIENRVLRQRLAMLYVAFVLFFAWIGFRLLQLQVFGNAALDVLSQKQFQRIDKKSPYRFPIYDRNREELAVSVPASSVFARPRLIADKRGTARVLAKILGGTPGHWATKLDTQKPFLWIHRQISEDLAKRISRQNLPGISLEPENKRVYPNGPLASQVVGFTDIDGAGIEGLEFALNDELVEKESKVAIARDGKGNPSYIGQPQSRPVARHGVYVTLDRRLQHAVEEELDRALHETGAVSVMAVVMDPFSGEIFAMGQRPTFDPNHANQYPGTRFTNRLTSHLYEPGSTLKVLLAAEAIQNRIMTPHTPIDCEDGKMTIGKKTIREAESNHQFKTLPLEKVIRYSSNIGAVKIAQALGVDRVRATLDKFGLTSRTGISLPGEVSAAPRGDSFWVPLFLATVGFGQGISVTPLQMVAAFAPFANGGYLVRPRILLRDAENDKLNVRRLLSPQTVQAMREMMVSVTEDKNGTGALARIPGIPVAGKTGTAQKFVQGGTGYEGKKYFSSFIGFLPANRPELLIGVMVDEPGPPYYASKVAAPLFKRIAERSLQILDRVPKRSVAQTDVQKTSPSKAEPSPEEVQMVRANDGNYLMPDLKGISMREAIRAVGRVLPNVKFSGTGYLTEQNPKPGTPVSSQTAVNLHFAPRG